METVKTIPINNNRKTRSEKSIKKNKQLKILKKNKQHEYTPTFIKKELELFKTEPIKLQTKTSNNKTVVRKCNNFNKYKEKPIDKFNRINVNINNKYKKPQKVFNKKFINSNTKYFDKLHSEDIYICSILSKDFNINKI